jgi:hypothetical protein
MPIAFTFIRTSFGPGRRDLIVDELECLRPSGLCEFDCPDVKNQTEIRLARR